MVAHVDALDVAHRENELAFKKSCSPRRIKQLWQHLKVGWDNGNASLCSCMRLCVCVGTCVCVCMRRKKFGLASGWSGHFMKDFAADGCLLCWVSPWFLLPLSLTRCHPSLVYVGRAAEGQWICSISSAAACPWWEKNTQTGLSRQAVLIHSSTLSN